MEFDWTINDKQTEFLNVVVAAANGFNNYRYITYGGAIRGGKTYAVAGVLILLCKMFPGSKWVVIRSDFPALNATTIPTFEKIIGASELWKWSRDKSNYYVEHTNGSRIFFRGENAISEPDLNSFLGLECNGIVLEQAEDLTEKMFNMAISRVGSWHIPREPKPLILSTFNPTQNWVKKKFYDPWVKGQLEAPYYYIKALPSDNPTNTDDQWAAWNRMDERSKATFIKGDWTNFIDKNSLWAFAFDYDKHVVPHLHEPDRNHFLDLSFDFNRNPICCSVIQHYDNTIYVHDTIKLANSDIYKLCAEIKRKYPGYVYKITGDASGKNSSAMVMDNMNYYTIIQKQFNLGPNNFFLPRANPRLEDNQVLVNSLLSRYNILIDEEKCKGLIFDFENVKTTPNGGIEKSNRSDETQQADALDTFRYFCNSYLANFVALPVS